jgi:predicted RNA-binding protein with RPS1 domain
VNINGADGLVHLSEISWERIDHPKEVLEVGQEVEVKVISIDRERRRIGLSLRQLQKDPWENYVKDYQVGQLIEGTITRLTKFGAFARIDENLEGLIHVSELSDKRIEHPKEVLSEHDVVTLRIIKIDMERRRIGLSLRKVESMQYSELDWEMALADVEGLEDFVSEEPPVDEPTTEIPTTETQTVESDTPEVEAEEEAAPVAEAEEEAAPVAEAEEEAAPVAEAEEEAAPVAEAEEEAAPVAEAEEEAAPVAEAEEEAAPVAEAEEEAAPVAEAEEEAEEQEAESDTPDTEPEEITEETNEAQTE